MTIVVLDGHTANPGDLTWRGLEALGEVQIYPRTGKAELHSRLAGADMVLTNKVPLGREDMLAHPRIKYIGVLATGYNIVDTESARELGVTVTNIPAYSTASVAQLTMALLLEICHHAGEHSSEIHQGGWSERPDFTFWRHPLTELAGKTFGILGYGAIGQAVGAVAAALGMQIIAHTRTPEKYQPNYPVEFVSLDELLRRAYVLSLHCPLLPETQGIIDDAALAKMNTGAILLNTSRGGVTDEAAVARALDSGRLSWAGIDGFSTEPPPNNHPLATHPRCICTPHYAWATKEARARLIDVAVSNARHYIEGAPVNVVS